MNGTTLLQLVRPPEGYRTERAVWLTHDLDTRAVTEHVLPALAGVVTPELGPRLAALAVLPPRVLTVAHAADRLTSTGFTSSRLVRMVGVLGRRQHAKMVVIRYERQSTPTGARVIWRTVVTSANLTLPGLRSNREVWVVDEIASNDRRATVSYVPPSISALRDLAKSKDIEGHALLDSTRALAEGLPSQLLDGSLTHSLETQTPLLAALGSGPFRRLLLCAPTFAGADASLVRHVRRLITPGADVDIVVPLESPRGATLVPVPLGLMEGLEAAGHRVTVHASRLFDHEGHGRRLHGKNYVGVHVDGTAKVVVGSPNLTSRGLMGHNRELVVSLDHPQGDQVIQEVIDELETVRPPISTTAASDSFDLAATVDVPPTPVFPFTPDPGSSPIGSIRGRLGLPLGRAKVTAARLDGLEVQPPTRTRLSRDSVLEAQVDAQWVPATVHIRCADEAGFWANVARDDLPPHADDLLLSLLRDLQRVRDG